MKKVIQIDYEEGEDLDKFELHGTVTLKRLNFSEKNSIEEESTEIKILGSVPQVKVSTSKIKELGLLKSIVESDLKKTIYHEDRVTKVATPTTAIYAMDITGIRELPQDVGEELLAEFTELNTVNEKKKSR